VDHVTDQTPPLPLCRFNRVGASPAHLRDYSCFSAVLSLHELHTYCEACTNPLWQQAMTEELQALEKTHTCDLVICLVVNLPLVANGSTRSKPNLMALLNSIRLVLSLRDMLRNMGLTMRRLLPLCSYYLCSQSFCYCCSSSVAFLLDGC
jgi:hypothetical protein